MSEKKTAAKPIKTVGKVSFNQLKIANESKGEFWFDAARRACDDVQQRYPKVDGVQFHGARAHQSHTVAAHSAVISAAFYAGDRRFASGHIHGDGTVDFKKEPHSRAAASSSKSSGKQGLSWRMNAAKEAEYLDGDQWLPGEWSAEHQLWIAHTGEMWHA